MRDDSTIRRTLYSTRWGLQTLEGDWQPKRVTVLEFPSLEQARRWYNSEEYRGPKALRCKTATSKMILVEGPEGATSLEGLHHVRKPAWLR